MDAHSFLQYVRREFDWHVRQHKESDVYRTPTLTNPIHPMFALDRWATGPGQDTAEIYSTMRPALQLASLWLSEDMPLLWFSHLTFGERRRNAAGQVFHERNPYYSTPEALQTVKTNLHEFGKTIIFSFAHPNCQRKHHGATHSCKESIPYFHEFNHADFPRVLSSKGFRKPCITLTRGFIASFRSTSLSVNERYRSLFMFAVVLCHEVAHGYDMFQDTDPKEPLWATDEKYPELGFSWELNVLGHLPMPNNVTALDGRFREISAVRMLEVPSNDERDKALACLKGNSCADFTSLDASGIHRSWPVLNGGRFRGAEWTLSSDAQFFIASFHVIPMNWIVSWFQRDVWEKLKERWVQNKFYSPPALGQTFMLIYERTLHGVQIHRPLYPGNAVDEKIFKEHCKSGQM